MNTLSVSLTSARFLPKTFKVTVWSRMKPYLQELFNRDIDSVEALEQWIYDRSELNATFEEELNKRYLKLSADVSEEKAIAAYNYLVQEVLPPMSLLSDQLNKKLIQSPYCDFLDQKKYFIYLRSIRNQLSFYKEENLDLLAEIKVQSQTYGKVFGQSMILHEGREQTITGIRKLLEMPDRALRKDVYIKIAKCLLRNSDALEELFDDLLLKRHQVALNAGFSNYRDYAFKQLGRFAYTATDCKAFHLAVQSEVLPLCNETNQMRRRKLNVDRLRPWDLQVNMGNERSISAFENIEELVEKTITCLSRIHPDFGDFLATLDRVGHLDLCSRKGKRPGGFHISMPLTKLPHIFMNATKSIRDVRTLIHECGHAAHTFLMSDLDLDISCKPAFEVAEMAAMAMELLAMDHWDVFYKDPEDLRYARINQLEKILNTLPWVSVIDRFQHWVYEHPNHTQEERTQYWTQLMKDFQSDVIDWEGYEHFVEKIWHRQPHVFKFPFYYIEYAFAQLGAIAIWKKYRENPTQTIQDFQDALSLGNTRSIREIYATAGISFDFSQSYIRELMSFVKNELDLLDQA